MNHVSFSKEYYVVDGRAKEVNARVCPGLATALAIALAIALMMSTKYG